jgi:hypothetical protein
MPRWLDAASAASRRESPTRACQLRGVLPRDTASLLTFPLRLPLSFGSLLAQELGRGIARVRHHRADEAPAFLLDG